MYEQFRALIKGVANDNKRYESKICYYKGQTATTRQTMALSSHFSPGRKINLPCTPTFRGQSRRCHSLWESERLSAQLLATRTIGGQSCRLSKFYGQTWQSRKSIEIERRTPRRKQIIRIPWPLRRCWKPHKYMIRSHCADTSCKYRGMCGKLQGVLDCRISLTDNNEEKIAIL